MLIFGVKIQISSILIKDLKLSEHIVWKSTKMAHLNFWILAFSTNLWPIKTDLSGNTVWPQALSFQNLAKLSILAFLISFCPLKM